ncbi:MAG: hypothetical protein ACYC5O_23725 [Anaerolineae bacterium]
MADNLLHDDREVQYIADSEALVGYPVKIWHRPPFAIVGYTLIVPPNADGRVPAFYDEVAADGRRAALKAASPIEPWLLGLSSWDSECEKKGFRYTICVEETELTDFSALAKQHQLFRMEFGESDWMCFEMIEPTYFERFWKDNPYAMIKPLGYRFGTRGLNLGVHFDAYPPGFDAATNPAMEFWITVAKRQGVTIPGAADPDE